VDDRDPSLEQLVPVVGRGVVPEEAPGRVVAEAVDADGARMRAVAVIRDNGDVYVLIVKALPDGFVLREAVRLCGTTAGW
jgi:hypothetical protein